MAFGRRNYYEMLKDIAAPTVSSVVDVTVEGTRSYTARMKSAGAAKATVTFWGSTVPFTGFESIGTIELETTGAGEDSGSFAGDIPWNYVKAEVSAITGTCTTSVWFGV